LPQLLIVPRVREPSGEYFVAMADDFAAGPDSTVSVSVWMRRLNGESWTVDQAPLAARITQLALVDTLFVAIALSQKKHTLAQLQRAGIELLEHRLINT
jgi:hypothetical protein